MLQPHWIKTCTLWTEISNRIELCYFNKLIPKNINGIHIALIVFIFQQNNEQHDLIKWCQLFQHFDLTNEILFDGLCIGVSKATTSILSIFITSWVVDTSINSTFQNAIEIVTLYLQRQAEHAQHHNNYNCDGYKEKTAQ